MAVYQERTFNDFSLTTLTLLLWELTRGEVSFSCMPFSEACFNTNVIIRKEKKTSAILGPNTYFS